MQMLKLWTRICLLTNCMVMAKFNKQNGVIENDLSTLLEDNQPSNIQKYQVSLRMKSLESVKFGNGHFCSGVMITNFVLTVAHCIQGITKKEIIVVQGSSNLGKKSNVTQIYRVRKMFVHEKYNKKSKMYDVALLELRMKDLKELKPKIYLGNENTIFDLDQDIECQMNSWGATESKDVSETLKKIDVKFISPEVCNATVPFTSKLREGMNCAVPSTKNGPRACTGDSGAPLFCNFKVVGLVSWGSESCKEGNFPTIFTEVGYYHDWIKSKMTKGRSSTNCDLENDYLEDSSNLKNVHIWVLHLNLLFLYAV